MAPGRNAPSGVADSRKEIDMKGTASEWIKLWFWELADRYVASRYPEEMALYRDARIELMHLESESHWSDRMEGK